jgi:hypothetical protein
LTGSGFEESRGFGTEEFLLWKMQGRMGKGLMELKKFRKASFEFILVMEWLSIYCKKFG